MRASLWIPKMNSTHSRTLGVVMDPIGSIKPYKDTTLALMLAAQKRGWSLRYLEQGDLYVRDGQAFGRVRAVEVHDDKKHWYDFTGESQVTPLGNLDVILMRKDPPFDLDYIMSTYILDRAAVQGSLVLNRPQSLRDCNEKLYTAWFPNCRRRHSSRAMPRRCAPSTPSMATSSTSRWTAWVAAASFASDAMA
jgi:glutathione synthase